MRSTTHDGQHVLSNAISYQSEVFNIQQQGLTGQTRDIKDVLTDKKIALKFTQYLFPDKSIVLRIKKS